MDYIKLLSFYSALVSVILLLICSLHLPLPAPSLLFAPLEMLPLSLVPVVLWSPMGGLQMWSANSPFLIQLTRRSLIFKRNIFSSICLSEAGAK